MAWDGGLLGHWLWGGGSQAATHGISGTVSGADATGINFTAQTSTSPLNLQVSFGLKQLRFTWDAVSGATSYKFMENADGASGFVQVGGDLTGTSYTQEIAVHRQNWAAAQYKVQACNGASCTDSNVVGVTAGMLAAIGYLKESNTGASDIFGHAVAISTDGNTLAVGAYGESSNATGIGGDQTNNSANSSGAVYLY